MYCLQNLLPSGCCRLLPYPRQQWQQGLLLGAQLGSGLQAASKHQRTHTSCVRSSTSSLLHNLEAETACPRKRCPWDKPYLSGQVPVFLLESMASMPIIIRKVGIFQEGQISGEAYQASHTTRAACASVSSKVHSIHRLHWKGSRFDQKLTMLPAVD